MARGGARTGKPGSAYTNRTDLHQAPKAAPGQQYGKAKEQMDAQRSMPLPSVPPVPSPAASAPPPPPGPPVMPGQFPLDAPTDRPNEPVTNGLPTGPGQGPEAIDALNPNTVDAARWGQYLPALEFMASQPDASMSTRIFVRRLRGMMPVEQPPGTTA